MGISEAVAEMQWVWTAKSLAIKSFDGDCARELKKTEKNR